MLSRVFAFASLLIAAQAQKVGTLTAETHPALTVSKCTASGCTTSAQSIVLDANWRWLHSATGSTNCYTGNTWDATLCPNNAACAANCALDGADYAAVYGITTSGNALRLNFVTKGAGTNVGSRTYLMKAGSTTEYESFNLLAQEFTFTVDVSKLPCGLNGALYFSQMDADGGMAKNPGNKAGAKYGTGYCDAQCPRDLKFINGAANVEGWDSATNSANSGTGGFGACCNEMDIWEANSLANAYTPHPCDSAAGLDKCSGLSCGVGDRYASKCDADGCDINPYRMGNLDFYGPGKLINTNLPLTVVTQFITDSGTNAGTLVDIKRFYVQGGVTYASPGSKIAGVTGNSINDAFCSAQKTAFGETHNEYQAKGGLAKQGEALKNSVLVMSIWDDYYVSMLWLNSAFPLEANPSDPGVTRGPCSRDSGKPKDVEANSPNAYVIYSDIRWGPINSTFPYQNVVNPDGGSPPVSSSTTISRTSSSTARTTAPVTTTVRTTTAAVTTTRATTAVTTTARTTAATTTSSGGNTALANRWEKCGGENWTGPTACVAPWKCTFNNAYYSQCL